MDEEKKWEPVEPLIPPPQEPIDNTKPEQKPTPLAQKLNISAADVDKAHHDYYMDESKNHSPNDQTQINLALKRERRGEIPHTPILPPKEDVTPESDK